MPLRKPVALGVKVTLTVQLLAGATLAQLLDCAKSAMPEAMPTPLNVSVRLPVLVTVTVATALVEPTWVVKKDTLVGLALAYPWVPVPASETDSVALENAALSVPASAPACCGENVAVAVHEAPTASVVPQLLEAWKLEPPAVRPTEVMLTSTLPSFVKVTVLAAELVPTTVSANDKLDTEAWTDGACASPVPVSATDLLPPLADAMSNVPVRTPAAVGANLTVTVHDAPAAMEPVQVVPVWLKSPALTSAVKPVMARLPWLLRVTMPVLLE